ncbi:MAG: biopolymer transporter ExbD [Polyangiaceae bacterium]|nr:biopolymer transporter ExbD [Polyangiaceae bacterium]
MRRPTLAIPACALFFSSLILLAGCDDPKKSGTASSAAATTAAMPAEPPPPPKPKSMPDLIVDPMGPYLNGQRVDMTQEGAAAKIAKIIKELPIEGKPVTVIAEKKAKTPHVAIVVSELGLAGAPKVLIKTDGRDDLPKEITVTPDSRVSSPPGCSVSTIVMKDLSTAVWPFKGGLGKRHRKGFAGPDLSHTAEQLKKDLAACDSTMAFFSGDDTIGWEMTYNLAGTVLTSDEKKKIDTLVIPRESPVAGRPVTLGKKE